MQVALRLGFSHSLASLRQRFNLAIVRSTIHLFRCSALRRGTPSEDVSGRSGEDQIRHPFGTHHVKSGPSDHSVVLRT